MFGSTFLSFAISLCLLGHSASAAVVSKTLTISNAQLSPDGFKRSTTVANGQFPGPLLSCNKGDNFKINVVDRLTDKSMRRATSVHWHGLFQAGSNEMDGPAWVNQCPIIPGHSFLYDFDVPDQSGTYWYHSHDSTQYCDGLRGPLVIYDPHDPLKHMYDVDDESTVITLGDWYHSVAPSLFPNPTDADPIPDSTTINGRGRSALGPVDAPLAVLNVVKGKRYRFRIVNTSCSPSYNFSINGHSMTVIEADGVETKPVTVDQLTIFAGQRYSVVVTADQKIGNYWIRANPSAGTTGYVNGINSAILRYAGAKHVEPVTEVLPSSNNTRILNEANLHPLINPGAPGEPHPGGVDYALNLVILPNFTTGRHSVNGVSWVPPSVPILLQVLSGTTNPADLLPKGSVYALPGNSVVELSMPGGFPHPMHLHGHNFDVVRVAGSSDYNYENPVRRDVVSIGSSPSDNVTIRFRTDNSGPWFMHCHIDWHLEGGLAVVFAENIPSIAKSNHVNNAWKNLCPDFAANNPDSQFE